MQSEKLNNKNNYKYNDFVFQIFNIFIISKLIYFCSYSDVNFASLVFKFEN